MDEAVAIGFLAIFVGLALETRHLREAAAQSQPIRDRLPGLWLIWATLGVNLLGVGLCLAGLFSAERWLLVAVTACMAVAVIATVGLWYFWSGESTRTTDQARAGTSSHWLRMFLKIIGGLVAIAALLFLGSFLGGGDKPSAAPAGRYLISGTCVNGSCFVNECSEPAPCAGKDPVGRLPEGARVDIDCQLRSKEPAKAPNDRVSYIWDRLASGAFISDLFVNTPRIGRFTKGLPRCSAWE